MLMRTAIDQCWIALSILVLVLAMTASDTPLPNETLRLQRLESSLTYRVIQHASIGDVDLASEVQE